MKGGLILALHFGHNLPEVSVELTARPTLSWHSLHGEARGGCDLR
eukprot:COSAG04_NODE_1164_length_8013_cov_11.222517_4_plen_45_part_00